MRELTIECHNKEHNQTGGGSRMKKWEWIGVTVLKEPRSKKKAAIEATALLERVTFSQPYGEMVTVIEDSESVRRTFQQLLVGKKTPSDGLILGYSDTAIALSLSSLTLTQQTGHQYCQAYFRANGLPKSGRAEKVNACQIFSELGSRFNTSISEYSIGEKAQLLASLTVHSDAELLCLDDYVVWTSSAFLVKVMSRLTELKETGTSIWLFTDQLTKVGAYCERVIWLQFGRLREVGQPNEVQGRYEAYLTSLHQMSLEEQQAYWAHGLESQRRATEERSSIKDMTEESPLDVSVEKALTSEEAHALEEATLSDEEEDVDRPDVSSRSASRPQQLKRSQSSNKTRPSQSGKFGRRVAVGSLVVSLSVGGGYLAVRHYLAESPPSSSLEAGPLVSNSHEEESESTVATFPDLSRRSESRDETHTLSSSVSSLASFTHQVKEGDSLSDLASRYEVSVAELREVNRLTDDTIIAGETLSLPATAKEGTNASSESVEAATQLESSPVSVNNSRPTVYTVVQGDTLFQIARRHGKSVLDLQQANQLQTPDLILGQELVIPD